MDEDDAPNYKRITANQKPPWIPPTPGAYKRQKSMADTKILKKMREFCYMVEPNHSVTAENMKGVFFHRINMMVMDGPRHSTLDCPLTYKILQIMMWKTFPESQITLPTMTQSFWRHFGSRIRCFFEIFLPPNYNSDFWLCVQPIHRYYNGLAQCNPVLEGDNLGFLARFYKPPFKRPDYHVIQLNERFEDEYKLTYSIQWNFLPPDEKFEKRALLKAVLFTFYCVTPKIIGFYFSMDILSHTLKVMDFDEIYYDHSYSPLLDEIRNAGVKRCHDRIEKWADKARYLPTKIIFND